MASPTFTTTVAALTDALKTVAPVIPKRPHVPALTGALLETDGPDLVVTANDFHTCITVRVPDAVVAPGRMLVPHAEVTKILKALVKGMPKQEREALRVTLRGHDADGTVTVQVGESTIPVRPLSMSEFPERPDIPRAGLVLPRAAFARAARRVLRVCGRDLTLPMTSGVKIVPDHNGLTLTATDRYRAGLAPVEARSALAGFPPEGTQVQGRELEAVLPVLTGDTVALGTGPDPRGDVVALSSHHVSVLLRVHEGELLDCRGVLPERTASTVTVDRAELRAQVDRSAGVLAAKGMRGGLITLVVFSQGLGVAPRIRTGREHMRMPVLVARVDGVSGDGELHFSSECLMDALESFDTDTITVHFQGLGRPAVVSAHPDGLSDAHAFKHLVMPTKCTE